MLRICNTQYEALKKITSRIAHVHSVLGYNPMPKLHSATMLVLM